MVNLMFSESTSIRYLIPIAKHLPNPRFFLYSSGKYNDPLNSENMGPITTIFRNERLRYEVWPELIPPKGTSIIVESNCLEKVMPTEDKVYVITYMADYVSLYPKYVHRAENIFFPNRKFAEAYSCTGPKNIYVGSPKYDIDLSAYNKIKPMITIFYPKNRDLNIELLQSIIAKIPSHYQIVVKSRAKDQILIDNERIVKSYDSYYPHTSLILIKRSDFIINFDSTTIKEAFYYKCPVINYKAKPEVRLDWFYDPKYPVLQANKDTTFDEMLAFSNTDFDWDMVHKDLLFEPGSAKKIADFIMSKE